MQIYFEGQIDKIIKPNLTFFVNSFNYTKISFPIFPNTYSLWRNHAFEEMKKLQSFKNNKNQSIYEFYLLSEIGLLKQFIENILKYFSSITSKNLIGNVPADVAVDSELLLKFNKALEKHTLYSELFQDLIRLPYLDDLFPKTRTFTLSQRYTPNIVKFKSEQQVTEKFSNSLVNKGIGFITEKIFTKSFLLQASSVAIRLNPIAMVASFAFAELISRYRKDKKSQEVSVKIQTALEDIQNQAEQLKNAYEECIELLGPALRDGGSKKSILKKLIQQVMIQDWLQIQKVKDDDGWEVVVLNGHSNCKNI